MHSPEITALRKNSLSIYFPEFAAPFFGIDEKGVVGAVLSIATADFAESSLRWYQHLKKEVAIGSGYIEKT